MKKKTKIKKENSRINKKMSLAGVLEKYPELGEVFIEEGLYCVGCPMSVGETVEQGCKAHGVDAEKIVEKLNKKLNKIHK